MRRHSKWFIPIFKRIKVSGDSMSPCLEDGDYVLIKKPRHFRPGLIYVINHSDLGRIIKRLKSIEGERLVFAGDNAASTPDTVIAPVNKNRVIGQAWLRVSPKGLRRL